MAIKVRCQRCRKKILIDEGFAGGAWRCPYCKAITMAPTGAGVSSGVLRPAAPGKPDAPAVPAGVEARQVETKEAVPLAKPIMIQGIVAMVLSGFLLLLVILGVILVLKLYGK